MKITMILTQSANSKSHSRPLIQKLFSASQPNNKSNDSKDGRIRNSVESREKADVKI
jgi:hypothetical protein